MIITVTRLLIGKDNQKLILEWNSSEKINTWFLFFILKNE